MMTQMGRALVVLSIFFAILSPGYAHAEKARAAQKRAKATGSKGVAPKLLNVTLENIAVTGGLDEKTARANVEKQLAALDNCYDRRHKKVSDLRGQMDFRLLVSGKGKVVSSTVEFSSVNDDELAKCARRKAMDLRFPSWKSGGHLTVRYSLRFFSGGVLGALMGSQIGTNFGYGGLNLKGVGGGGVGSGTIGLGTLVPAGKASVTSSPVPTIRTGTASVRGSLSKEIIRRHIRRHINQIRYCYEQQLAQHPNLTGRISVRFVISSSGSVQTSSVAGSTLGNSDVENCVARAVKRIAFPQPEGGGVVLVTYPFMFQNSQTP